MGGLLASATQLPFLLCTCVLGGFAIWGWRRSGATGALLVAVACGVRLVHELFGVYSMVRMYTVGPSEVARTAMVYGVFQSAGALIADVLFIVGVALLLRRLPPRAR